MDENIIVLILFMTFFVLYFFTTQKIYSHTYWYVISAILFIFSVALFITLNKKYPEQTFQYSAFLISFYCLLLFLIKLSYRKLNTLFAKKRWVSSEFANKDFTYVTLSEWGDNLWEKNAFKPSWLDHVLSTILLVGPILLMIWTIRLV
jgi:hypothetical protein